ncbi:RNase adapter RapZ [Novilysobacter antarcticus]|uniref:RNase adapter RapZ n=1 Tax=Novilysobacter antarcticus TaxID=2862543 RepID=UPI001C9A0434|nr:RNase adapter RapZ [Lysobacter antarcticus]
MDKTENALPPHPTDDKPVVDASLVIVSGMSGSGKSVALKTFEDLGYYCVDNLPAELLPAFVRAATANLAETETAKLAVGIDVRTSHRDLASIPGWLAELGKMGMDPRVIFLETRDDILIKRYADTRRRHPLSHLGLALADAIALERQVLRPLRQLADSQLDTSELNVHQMRRHIITRFALGDTSTVSLLFESFAYRHGVPADADFVFDARCLPNPHWDPGLRPLSGRDAPVAEFFANQPLVNEFANQVGALLETWLPRLHSDTSRSYITVAFGCTGGRHRSVYLAERMAQRAREQGWDEVAVHHRELD